MHNSEYLAGWTWTTLANSELQLGTRLSSSQYVTA